MTLRQQFEKMLVEHLLWPDQAKAVMDLEIAKDKLNLRWNEPNGYPDPVLSALWISAKQTAVNYLKETKPMSLAIKILEWQ